MAELTTERFKTSDGRRWEVQVAPGLSDEAFYDAAMREVEGGRAVDLSAPSQATGGLPTEASLTPAYLGGELPTGLGTSGAVETTTRRMIPSVVGGAVGGALGTAVAPGPGTVAGASIGSMAGEAVQQYFDPLQTGADTANPSKLSIAAAGVPALVPPMVRGVLKGTPGAGAGLQELLQQRIGKRGEMLIDTIIPPQKVDDLFRVAAKSGALNNFKTTHLGAAVQAAKKEAGASALSSAKELKDLGRVEAMAAKGDVPWTEFRATMIDLGGIVRRLDKQGGPGLGRAKQLYKAMWDDLDSMSSVSGATEELKAAVKAFKQEQATDFIDKAFASSASFKEGLRQINVNLAMTKIDRHRDLLKKMIPESTIDEVLETLAPHGRVPMITSLPSGVDNIPGMGGVARLLTTAPGRAIVRWVGAGMSFDQIVNAIGQAGREVALPQPSLIPIAPKRTP